MQGRSLDLVALTGMDLSIATAPTLTLGPLLLGLAETAMKQ